MAKQDLDLSHITRLGIDTAPIIYFIEAHPKYDPVVTKIFQDIATGTITGITSMITLTEVLVHPLRLGETALEQRYRDLLLLSDNFEIICIDAVVAENVAGLRARYNLRTPDALQLAAAIVSKCEAFLTNDKNIKNINELNIILLDELRSS